MFHCEVLVTGGFLNTYGIHQAVWSLFPNDGAKRRDFLYRVEAVDRRGRSRLLLQSCEEPVSSEVAVVRSCEPHPIHLAAKGRRHFSLVANPTKQVADRGRRGRRIALKDEADQRGWLLRKLGDAAEVETVAVHPLPMLRFFQPRRDFQSGFIGQVLYTGVLRVTDEAAFAALLRTGVGPSKSFGCGLLTVLPATPATQAG